MKPASFHYHAPHSVEEALGLLRDYEFEGVVLAGGQSLLPMLNFRLARPAALIDICRIPGLEAFEVEDDRVRIGAAVRQRTVELHPQIGRHWPLLTKALHLVGHPQIRNRGTLCGSLAHADPASELCAAMVALDAVMVVRTSGGERRVPAAEFFLHHFTTAIEPGEILQEVVLPRPDAPRNGSYQEVAARPGDFAHAGVAVNLAVSGTGEVADARIVCAGVGPGPVRAYDAERHLTGRIPDEPLIDEVGRAVTGAVEPHSDIHASADYRRRLSGELTKRGIVAALSESLR